jgi:serine/threonine protein kinase
MAPAAGERAGAALLIGIGQYLHSEQVWPLRFAARDAQTMAEALVDPEVCAFPPRKVKVLTDAAASRDAVAHHLSKWLPEQAQDCEIAVIYFAGHGMVSRVGQREEGYLLPHDADPDDLQTRGVLMMDLSRWIEAIEARVVVVCLDCCHAAKVIPRGGNETPPVARDMRIRPGILQGLAGRGRYLIASCDDGQVSVEAEAWGHGLFTHHLLNGIRGAGDLDRDGKVGIAELFEYVAAAVERDALSLGMVQRPWSSAIGPGGTFLSARRMANGDKSGPGRWPEPAGSARRRLGEPSSASLLEIERLLDQIDAPPDAELLRRIPELLVAKTDPEAIPLLFRCLTHPDEQVRERARTQILAMGWDRARSAIENLARAGTIARFGAVLDGLAALEAHPDVVALLDRLVSLLKGDLRNRTILLLERKRLSLEVERIAACFRSAGSPYRIQRALGQGLFTAAYLARDEETDLDVVVRVLRPEFASQPPIRAEFLDLGRRSVKLVHHNLVLTREIRTLREQDLCYMVRDFVDGVTLQKVLESAKVLGSDQILKVLRQLLEALTPFHREAWCHGAIKPSNVFLCQDDRVILGDPALPIPGIGLELERMSYDFRYAPPELFRSGGTIGRWSDFYSLGCLAHELACGFPPFESDNPYELAAMHIREAVQPPSRRGSRLDVAGDPFLLRLLGKIGSERFADIDQAMRGLETVQASLRARARLGPTPGPLLGDASLIPLRAADALVSVISFSSAAPIPAKDGTAAPPGAAPTADDLRRMPAKAAVERVLDDSGDEVPKRDQAETDDAAAFRQNSASESGPQQPAAGRFGRYKILRKIGEGGMGAVYLARDEHLDRVVAIKTLGPDAGHQLKEMVAEAGSGAVDRFLREARAVGSLDHPNIVSVYDIGEQDGSYYIVLQYVEGGSLERKLVSHGAYAPDEAASLMLTLARAVDHAHSLGIIHRDLKPSNILLTKNGEPMIADFGLARITRFREEDATLTMSGQIMGTPSYMAPEQAAGSIDQIGPATDVYALGTIFYELLTGQRPFQGRGVMQILVQVRESKPLPPRQRRQEIPPELERICLRCLEKDPGRRYGRAAELADDLERFQRGHPIAAGPSGVWNRLRRSLWSRKSSR